MAVIYLFGDSITYGAWDIQGGGWAARLRKYLDEKQEKDSSLYYLTYDLGIPGESTDGLVRRFESEMLARDRKNEEKVIVIAFGANDSALLLGSNEFKVPVERFESNLEAVLQKAEKLTSKIFLLNITPVVEDVVASQMYGKKKKRTNEYIEKYNVVISAIANKSSLKLIDVYSAFNNSDCRTLFSEDGLHPNEKGHQMIFEMMKDLF